MFVGVVTGRPKGPLLSSSRYFQMQNPGHDHLLVKGVVEGARRKLARPVQPKQPLAHDTIASITFSLNSASASLADLRFLFILFVGYTGVFRICEVFSIRVKDVSILEDFMSVYLVKRKK